MIDAVVLSCVMNFGNFYSEPASRGARTAACLAVHDYVNNRVLKETVDYISLSAQYDWKKTTAYEWEIIGREEARLKKLNNN